MAYDEGMTDETANLAALSACPTTCDEDCAADCHEEHAVAWKRAHQPHNCPARAEHVGPPCPACQEPLSGDGACWSCDWGPEPLPERIGYDSPWPRIEYGVFEDRRSKGLGFALVETTENGEHAVSLLTRECEYPLFLRQRVVVYQPWARTERSRTVR